jgi:hypothetical protein
MFVPFVFEIKRPRDSTPAGISCTFGHLTLASHGYRARRELRSRPFSD